MDEYKNLFGLIAMVISFVGFVPYLWNIFKGTTKPHAFTWLVWSVLNVIIFAVQVFEGAGAGAWAMALNSALSFIIFILALFKGTRDFPLFDWFALFAAIIALLLWRLTNDPTWSVLLITLTDFCAFLPTFRKSFNKPYEETASTFALSAVQFVFALLALQNYVFANWFYPAALIILDGGFALLLIVRRKMVTRTKF